MQHLPIRSSNRLESSLGVLRLFAAGFTVMLFVWAILNAGRMGYSRTLANAAAGTDTIAWADKAVEMSPRDPQVHYLRADVLKDLGRLAEATKELENAASLRPRHYSLELRLAYERERMQDSEGALRAYQHAVRLAPYYAQPRWYLGHFLLKTGQQKPAFAELRRAADSDPVLLDDLINFAGEAFGDDARAIEEAVQPQSDRERLALAAFLVERRQTAEAMTLFHSSSAGSAQELRTLLEALLSFKRYPEAFEVWSRTHNGAGGMDSIVNGGFETPIALNEPGFGWQVAANDESVGIYSDSAEPGAELRSLRLDFNGTPDPSSRLLYQIVLVQPNARYQLNFSARASELATLSLPVIAVTDAAHWSHLLGWTAIARDTAAWSNHTVEFTTDGSTTAVIVSLEREACDASCAIYGHVWLDNFSLRRF
jgi:Flp pilus assembly protein TadD